MHLKERFEEIDAALLDSFVDRHEAESLHLDFKTFETCSDRLLPSDRKMLAKVISGFANSDGGIVVWGVNARRGSGNGIDGAQDLAPMKHARQLLGELERFTGEATSPVVDGIEHRLLLAPDEQSSGFLVSYIPRSDAAPHMAKLGENRYYKRSGESFYVMEHFDLEDMFGRRPHPILSVRCRPVPHSSPDALAGC